MNPNPQKKNPGISQLCPGMVGGFVLVLLSSLAIAKTPEQIFARVSPSVVEVEAVDAHGQSIGQGSGVGIGEGQVITACHVIKEGKNVQVRQAGKTFKATLRYADTDRDLCQLNAPDLQVPPIALGSAGNITVGQRVYAIGAPRGPESTPGEGVVSNLRPHGGSRYMQISAAGSAGSSGGGLVDDQGRLVGILSLQSVDHQSLAFALPVEWIGELTERAQPVPVMTNKGGLDRLNRIMALEKKGEWRALLKLAQQEVKRDPTNASAWYSVGVASDHLKHYSQAVHAYREAIRNQAEYDEAWHKLGVAYANLKEYDHAVHAYREALRLQPENAAAWYDRGNAHHELRQYAHAIHAYREALRIRRDNADAWYKLGVTYDDMDLYGEAVEAYLETVRIQPENADAWYNLGVDYALLGERGKIRGIYQALRKLDPARAERYFNTYMLP